jgi:hypothetical protein
MMKNMIAAALLVFLLICTQVSGLIVPMRGTHQNTASLCASANARMPSSNFPKDVEEVRSFFNLFPPEGQETQYVWTYERSGNLCKVIPVCPSGRLWCDDAIKVSNCNHKHISICLNVPSE